MPVPWLTPASAPQPCRAWIIRAIVSAVNCYGLVCGARLRSCNPATPSSACPSIHLYITPSRQGGDSASLSSLVLCCQAGSTAPVKIAYSYRNATIGSIFDARFAGM